MPKGRRASSIRLCNACWATLRRYGRDPLAPIKDAVTADGDIKVPLDAEAFGFWLKAAFGNPTTTGTTNKTHTFKSGSWALPSMAIEVAMPEIPRFAMYTGCVLDQLNIALQRSGLLTADVKLVAQGENVATATAAGTPTAYALQRFGHFNGAIKRNGTALGNIVSADLTYANNVERIETKASIEGGERYDWFYASSADRDAQVRTPISDGFYNEPWLFRPKDMRNWWQNAHHDRLGGVRFGFFQNCAEAHAFRRSLVAPHRRAHERTRDHGGQGQGRLSLAPSRRHR